MNLKKRIDFPTSEIDVVTMGELLIDIISTDYVPTLKEAVHFTRSFGGSPGNIAVNLSKMKCRTAVIASVGQDEFGQYLVDSLQEQSVNTLGIQRVPTHTTMVFVTKSLENPLFLPVRGADCQLVAREEQHRLIDKTKIFHFSAWALSCPEVRQTTMELVRYARSLKKVVSFDPNYRACLWESGHEGPGFIRDQVLPLVDIIKPSESDAESLWGPQSIEGHLGFFQKREDQLVMLTLGAEGTVAAVGKERVHVPSYASKVVDTTGAGDAFWAGFLSGLLRGNTIEEALLQGSYCAGYKLGTTGAICNLPSHGLLKEWAENIQEHK